MIRGSLDKVLSTKATSSVEKIKLMVLGSASNLSMAMNSAVFSFSGWARHIRVDLRVGPNE